MLLYYIRHADPIYNPDSLTPLGHRQAEAIGRRLASHGIDKIYASSSIRAQLTAKPLAEMLKKDVTVLDWAHEDKFWKEAACKINETDSRWYYHQHKFKEIMLSPECRALGREWYKHPAFADTGVGAGIERLQREVNAFLAAHGYEHDMESCTYRAVAPNNEKIALFAHQGVGEGILSAILDIPYNLFATHMDMSHSCMSVIEFNDKMHIGTAAVHGAEGKNIIPRMITYANDSHIYAEHLPTRYENDFYF